jgi:predicted TIM-barrel fold metal-dependent hydrolase
MAVRRKTKPVVEDLVQELKPQERLLMKIRVDLKCKNDRQKNFIRLINKHDIVVCAGPAGTGKTESVKDLAKAKNVTMKISGVAMTDPQFSKKSLKPWVDTCVNAFGPDRCVIGSNWPVDRLFSSFDVIMNFYREYIEKLSTSEQKKILNKNASKLYKF